MQVFLPRPDIAPAAEIGRQEGLGIDHPRLCRFLQNRQHQPLIITRRLQDRSRRLIDFQEVPEVLVAIVPLLIEDPRYVQMLLLRQSRDKAGRRGAFQMQMQFDLG
jgi:hypothetical protein